MSVQNRWKFVILHTLYIYIVHNKKDIHWAIQSSKADGFRIFSFYFIRRNLLNRRKQNVFSVIKKASLNKNFVFIFIDSIFVFACWSFAGDVPIQIQIRQSKQMLQKLYIMCHHKIHKLVTFQRGEIAAYD